MQLYLSNIALYSYSKIVCWPHTGRQVLSKVSKKTGIRHICSNLQQQHVEIYSMQLQDNNCSFCPHPLFLPASSSFISDFRHEITAQNTVSAHFLQRGCDSNESAATVFVINNCSFFPNVCVLMLCDICFNSPGKL